jgi:3'(2'), 5'-bisphosphate nucleotidase
LTDAEFPSPLATFPIRWHRAAMTVTPDALAQLALEAGAIIDRVYHSDFAHTAKADDSPVTEADHLAEAHILAGLARLEPGLIVIAEEEVSLGKFDAGRLQGVHRFALVDPLDGTREFLKRNGEFTVNVAIIENGRPVMGVVYAPAKARLFVAASPHEAWQSPAAPGAALPTTRKALRIRRAPQAGLTVLVSGSHPSPETENWLKDYSVQAHLPAGSSLKFFLIAAGEGDIYPRLGPTSQWDTAAGQAVLEAAGGRVLKMDGSPLLYDASAASWLNPHFVAYGDVSPAGRSAKS